MAQGHWLGTHPEALASAMAATMAAGSASSPRSDGQWWGKMMFFVFLFPSIMEGFIRFAVHLWFEDVWGTMTCLKRNLSWAGVHCWDYVLYRLGPQMRCFLLAYENIGIFIVRYTAYTMINGSLYTHMTSWCIICRSFKRCFSGKPSDGSTVRFFVNPGQWLRQHSQDAGTVWLLECCYT